MKTSTEKVSEICEQFPKYESFKLPDVNDVVMEKVMCYYNECIIINEWFITVLL